MTQRLSDVELDAWQALLHAHERLVRTLDTELRTEHGITFTEYDVLLRLARADARRLRMSELAQRVMISPSGLTRAVDRVVEAGFVTRQRDAADARVVIAELTPIGRATVRRAARTHLRGIREHYTARLSETQLRQVASALQVIAGTHQDH